MSLLILKRKCLAFSFKVLLIQLSRTFFVFECLHSTVASTVSRFFFCIFESRGGITIQVDSTCRFISGKIFFSGWSVSSDKADSLGVRLEFMKEGQHHRNKTADWSELSRIHYPSRILTPTKFRRLTEEAGLGVKREKK